MITERQSTQAIATTLGDILESRLQPTVACYERQLIGCRATEVHLRAALVQDETLLLKKDKEILQQQVRNREANHRLLNGLQIVASILSLQSRKSLDSEVASQLDAAAIRVAMIERIHRRLHSIDGVQTVALKKFLTDFCIDYSKILSLTDRPDKIIVVDGVEVELSAAVGSPLALIVSELITNAVKYGGNGPISVTLECLSDTAYALSVSNGGPSLPEGFDPATSKGLGMGIVKSLVGQIGGELQCNQGDRNRGARFTVLFCSAPSTP